MDGDVFEEAVAQIRAEQPAALIPMQVYGVPGLHEDEIEPDIGGDINMDIDPQFDCSLCQWMPGDPQFLDFLELFERLFMVRSPASMFAELATFYNEKYVRLAQGLSFMGERRVASVRAVTAEECERHLGPNGCRFDPRWALLEQVRDLDAQMSVIRRNQLYSRRREDDARLASLISSHHMTKLYAAYAAGLKVLGQYGLDRETGAIVLRK